jgi:hypothetical protein
MTKTVSQEWIEFGKKLLQQETNNSSNITNEQWNWFGRSMEILKQDSQFPIPCGTECRKYPRAFYALVKGGNDFVLDFLTKWSKYKDEEIMLQCLYGNDAIYDLIILGTEPVFND